MTKSTFPTTPQERFNLRGLSTNALWKYCKEQAMEAAHDDWLSRTIYKYQDPNGHYFNTDAYTRKLYGQHMRKYRAGEPIPLKFYIMD